MILLFYSGDLSCSQTNNTLIAEFEEVRQKYLFLVQKIRDRTFFLDNQFW